MRKIRALILALAVAFGVSIAAETPQIASAATYAKTGVSLAPYCDWAFSASSGIAGSRYLSMSANYSGCDLMVSDYLYSPNMCIYAFDVEDAASSSQFCTGHEQNRTHDSVSGRWQCHVGHRLKVDIYIWAWRGTVAQGGRASIRIVCGGKSW